MCLSTSYWGYGLTNQPERLRVSLVTPVKGISLTPFQMCSTVTEIVQFCPFDFIYSRTHVPASTTNCTHLLTSNKQTKKRTNVKFNPIRAFHALPPVSTQLTATNPPSCILPNHTQGLLLVSYRSHLRPIDPCPSTAALQLIDKRAHSRQGSTYHVSLSTKGAKVKRNDTSSGQLHPTPTTLSSSRRHTHG